MHLAFSLSLALSMQQRIKARVYNSAYTMRSARKILQNVAQSNANGGSDSGEEEDMWRSLKPREVAKGESGLLPGARFMNAFSYVEVRLEDEDL